MSGDADKVNVFLEIIYIPIEDKCEELSKQECLVSNVSKEDNHRVVLIVFGL